MFLNLQLNLRLDQQLHIVCLNFPWPADCGSAIDVVNRIKAFHKSGVKVHLHYFSCGEGETTIELNKFCKTVTSYKRKNLKECFSFKTPFIVASHINKDLIHNLSKDNHPVLLEGLHTTGILGKINTGERKICVRIRNNEALYYKELARCTGNPSKKLHFIFESRLIDKYSKTLPSNIAYACTTENDTSHLNRLSFPNVFHIPTFTEWQKINCPTGIGNLCLFHGNLSVAENERAALWLLSNVFNKVRVPFVIAGKRPSRRLKKAAELCQHTCLVADPSDNELQDLIKKAHINILPFLNKNITGSRLKLLHALFEGRHCVVNREMVHGTGLERACHIGNNSNELTAIISQLYYQPFLEDEILLREKLLEHKYNNDENIKQFANLLW